MKILELRLLAFGLFTDTVLDLGGGEEGLHIIYGLNEAGKSSALRALRQMLYGIPERAQDDYQHPYAKMRIGAVLKHSDGSVLEFIRRKGRANTLRAADDSTPMDESHLSKFLGGMSADLFATMFGIDHADLVRGGKEIIQGGGTVGQILFAAGAGLSELRRVQEELESEADGLFRPSGQRPRINEAIARFKKSQRELRDAQLPGQEWLRHDQALRDAVDLKQRVDQDLGRKQAELHRLKRIREGLPTIARRKDFIDQFKSYAGAVLLPDDFGERRRELLTSLRIAQNDKAKEKKSIEEIERAVNDLEISEALLERAELIEQIHQELGGYLKAAKDRTQLVTRRDALWDEAREILSGLRDDLALDEAEKLRLKKTEAVKIQQLGSQYERLITQLEGARNDVTKLANQLDGLEKELEGLEAPRQIESLKTVMERAMKYGALEEHYQTEISEIRNTQASQELALAKQTLWSGTLDELERLPLPSSEAIDLFEDRFAEAHQSVIHHEADIKNLEDTLLEIEGKIEEIRLEQEVPTEEDLQDAKRERDMGWRLVRRAWEEGYEPEEEVQDFVKSFPPAKTLAEAFELSIDYTDEIVDRLRREADRVARKAKLLADRETQRTKSRVLKTRLEHAKTVLQEIEMEWSKLWEPAGISPQSPREMRMWSQDQRAIVEKVTEMRERNARVIEMKSRIGAYRIELDQSFQSILEPPAVASESLSDLITRGQKVIQREEETRNIRAQLRNETEQREKELGEARSKVKRLEEELSKWQYQWENAIAPLGLDAEAIPAQANATLDELKSLFDTLKDAGVLHKRIEGINRDAEDFSRKVTSLGEYVERAQMERPVDQTAAELNAKLNQARTAKSKQESLEKQQHQAERRLKKAEGRIAEIESELGIMCEEASCSNYDELPEVEKRSAKRREIETELQALEKQLLKLSAGARVEAYVGEAQQIDPDSIGPQIDRLNDGIEELNKKRSELDQTIGSERTELSKMDGSARAAELAEETQMILGRLDADVEQYVRLRLASTVLNQAIERYREKHQGPTLKRANDLFSRMTLGSFEGIRVEFDDQSQPMLVGIRPGGKEIVTVDCMSDGTADQLYLALRLASLENYLEKDEPLPFVVDDILIRFDNDRAAAALQALEKLSGKTQVIFFTHHQHLVGLAEANVDPAVLFKHSLGV
jgi:uncharacterized protein YhaN